MRGRQDRHSTSTPSPAAARSAPSRSLQQSLCTHRCRTTPWRLPGRSTAAPSARLRKAQAQGRRRGEEGQHGLSPGVRQGEGPAYAATHSTRCAGAPRLHSAGGVWEPCCQCCARAVAVDASAEQGTRVSHVVGCGRRCRHGAASSGQARGLRVNGVSARSRVGPLTDPGHVVVLELVDHGCAPGVLRRKKGRQRGGQAPEQRVMCQRRLGVARSAA
jgi:hypothetical protein